MKKKSSLNFINGDKKISLLSKVIYSFFFLVEIIFEKKCHKNYKYDVKFEELLLFWGLKKEQLNEINLKSPCRIAIDVFLIDYLKKNFQNKKISILDIGCGKAKYLQFLRNLGYDVEYFGIDAQRYKHWDKYASDPKIKFLIINLGDNQIDQLNNLKKYKSNFDLIYSNSSFEHIRNDLLAFNEILSLYPNTKNVHFIPAAYSFLSYLQHGWRRYNRKIIRKIFQNLNLNLNIYGLSNNESFSDYLKFYKFEQNRNHPLNFIFQNKDDYNAKKTFEKISRDSTGKYPSFYAITF